MYKFNESSGQIGDFDVDDFKARKVNILRIKITGLWN